MEKKKKFILVISFLVFLFSLLFLVSGSKWLLFLLMESPQIPLGNLTTALGLIAFPIWIYTAFDLNKNTNKLVLNLLRFNIVLNIFWWPIGRYLSGNWRNSFENIPEKSQLFMNYTIIVLGLTLVIVLTYFILLIYRKVTQKSLH